MKKYAAISKIKKMFIVFSLLSINANAKSPQLVIKNNTELAIAFLKSQDSSTKDSEITIHPTHNAYNLDSCTDIHFSTIQNTHPSTNLRFLATCKAPQNWTLFLNATIKKKQNYLITRRSLKRGEIITTQDVQLKFDAKSSTISNAVTKLDEVNNLAASHDIKIGTILRQSDLSEPILITRYQQVKIISKSNGFSVATFGKSLNNATKDRSVRVQLSNKLVVTGKAVSVGTVEISN